MTNKFLALVTMSLVGLAPLTGNAEKDTAPAGNPLTKIGKKGPESVGANAIGHAPNSGGHIDGGARYTKLPNRDVRNSPALVEDDGSFEDTRVVEEEGDVIAPQTDAVYDRRFDRRTQRDTVVSHDAALTTTTTELPLAKTEELANIFAKLHHANMTEIEMGKLAMEKGQSRDVRAFGERLMRDHQMTDRKLMAYAESKNIPVNLANVLTPAESAREHLMMTKLQAASTADFDRQFLQAMADDHHQDVNEMTVAIDRMTDSNAQSFLRKIRPILGQHESVANILLQKQRT